MGDIQALIGKGATSGEGDLPERGKGLPSYLFNTDLTPSHGHPSHLTLCRRGWLVPALFLTDALNTAL